MSKRAKSCSVPTTRAEPRPLAAEQAEAASYIADMTAELARMAGQRQLDMLTYLLNMARVEAEMIARRDPDLELQDAAGGTFA